MTRGAHVAAMGDGSAMSWSGRGACSARLPAKLGRRTAAGRLTASRARPVAAQALAGRLRCGSRRRAGWAARLLGPEWPFSFS